MRITLPSSISDKERSVQLILNIVVCSLVARRGCEGPESDTSSVKREEIVEGQETVAPVLMRQKTMIYDGQTRE